MFLGSLILLGTALALAALAVNLLLQQADHLAELFILALFGVDGLGGVLHPLFKSGDLLLKLLAGVGDLLDLFLELSLGLRGIAAHVVDIF